MTNRPGQPAQNGPAEQCRPVDASRASALHVRLQQARLACGLTLKNAAGQTGVGVLHLSNLERGKVRLDQVLRATLAELYAEPSLLDDHSEDHAVGAGCGATPEEQARLARLEFRRHQPLSDVETAQMLDLLRQLGPAHQQNEPVPGFSPHSRFRPNPQNIDRPTEQRSVDDTP